MTIAIASRTEDIRRALVEDLADAERALADQTAALDDFTDDELDPDSRSHTSASRQRAVDAIADITAALERLDAGTYGTCTGCGEPVAADRLEALPTTRHCIGCATAGRAG